MKSTRNVSNTKRRRRMSAILWSALVAIGTMLLLYFEQTALLYILATLGVTAILVIVAASDLARGEKPLNVPAQADDSAAIGSGIVSTYGTNKP
ncbi:MAG: hypothetical protein H7Z16_14260 [Pyrinomonadaceae bacterium]|nr:hypothetical protein [Pyrinomonadaceae bacterium]